ncbi:carbohydrate ABC transporter permease [Microbacterium luticocti]|uniref:carbohydrate ABC transporter permease n=1 Tax=Microbacterium luticocti TaxID=451764 RepID=UPI00041F7C18|nr:sugar ABC transporter permease [Microbacterium luticocti]
MTAVVDAAADPAAGSGHPVRSPRNGRGRRVLLLVSFLAPALVVLGALVVYPIVYTLIRSFYGVHGEFTGWDNYVRMFTNQSTFTAIRNNIMWVIVAPITCTVLGLIFAVLLEKLKWKTAFKLIIFMPMAISMLAAGVIFRGMFQENPNLGVVNAVLVGVNDAFSAQASYPGARPRDGFGIIEDKGVVAAEHEVAAGSVQDFPLVGVKQSAVPDTAEQAAAAPAAKPDQITGTVFLDVVPGGGGTQGQIGDGKKGLPGIRVDAVAPDGSVKGYATTGAGGTFTIEGLAAGQSYRVALPASNFAQGFQGVSWLSPALINVVIILSYVWIWAGFAMVMIASGLSAMDRSLQEASRIDGANEWQVFTRITAPLLSPVLIVVFVTLIINVLKIFDLVYVIPPGESKPAANVIAVEMWTVSFGGGNDQGLGSALAILLLILVLPSMIINVRRFREERSR